MPFFYLHFLLIFFGISRVSCLSVVSRRKVCAFFWNSPLFQAEVWDLEVLRSNHSSWPITVADVKEGLITVKGHMQVRGSQSRRNTQKVLDRWLLRSGYVLLHHQLQHLTVFT